MTECDLWEIVFFWNPHLLHAVCIYVQRCMRVIQHPVCKNGRVECNYVLWLACYWCSMTRAFRPLYLSVICVAGMPQ
jgi:hypothetical protein